MITKEQADEKVEKGWIRVWLGFEVIAVNQETTEKFLESIINHLDTDKRAEVYKKEFKNVKKLEKIMPKVDVAYSKICEIKVVFKRLEDLVEVAIEYAPSAIEILEPKKLSLDLGEAQGILNSISGAMQKGNLSTSLGFRGVVLGGNE